MCWKYSTWWRPLIWVFKDFLSQTQPTGISSFTPDQVNNNSKFWKHLGSTFPAVNWGAKPLQLHQTYFAALSLIQKLHLAKNWAKTAFSVNSRVWNNLQTAMQGCHCQLDDQCRGHSIKEKDQLAGKLTIFQLMPKSKSNQTEIIKRGAAKKESEIEMFEERRVSKVSSHS